MTRRVFLALAIALGRVPGTARAASAPPPPWTVGSVGTAGTAAPTDRVRVGVFGLFHPRALSVRPGDDSGLAIVTDRDTLVLRGRETADVRIVNGSTMQVTCAGRSVTTDALRVAGAGDGITDVELSVPGRITRLFRGQLDITLLEDELVSVVSMDLETAVASVVAAEQIASTPLEALKAQAIAARSYFVASRGRHRGFDFCDTTHCQFLREPPAPDRRAARAARETAGQVLAYRDRTIPAFYSASCGGRTRSLADVGRPVADGYPYFSVDCAYCGRQTNGQAQGHGLGLCQVGAADLAATRHAPCADILAHYYPGTNLQTMRRSSSSPEQESWACPPSPLDLWRR
jgi:stage II sporulation protein D